MLQELRAQNFALFHDVYVAFRPGFTAITGETGSGKSLLVNSLALLLGRKAEAFWIREGEREAVVECVFSLEDHQSIRKRLKERGLPYDEGLFIRRIICRDGRNRIYINDSPVTLRCLQEVTQGIVEVLSQREGLRLLKRSHHLPILDAFARVTPLREEYQRAYRRYMDLVRQRETLEKDQEERLRRMDYLAFQIRDIQEASPQIGEEEQLREKRNWLREGERLREALSQAALQLDGEETSATHVLRQVLSLISPLGHLNDSLGAEVTRLKEILLQLQESATVLQRLLSQVEVDPHELALVEERLDLLHRLKSRYGATIEDVLNYLKEAEEEYARLEALQASGEEIEGAIRDARGEVEELGRRLSGKRREGAREMEKKVEATLERLLMKDCRFEVVFDEREEPGLQGMESVSFFIRPNVGEEAKPLNRVASGGELSRITLAIHRVLSDIEGTPVLVLDEIDAGIGGVTAHRVGELLAELGNRYQVICVTHLPQVARHSHQQLVVEKTTMAGKTVTHIRELAPSEREEELRRMIGEVPPMEESGDGGDRRRAV